MVVDTGMISGQPTWQECCSRTCARHLEESINLEDGLKPSYSRALVHRLKIIIKLIMILDGRCLPRSDGNCPM